MTEHLLQYIWKHRLYDTSKDLVTTDGELLTVIYPGILNRNAGPDFLESRIRIGNTMWVGPVEIHLRSSDWKRHQHEEDARYARIILHVVNEDDAIVVTQERSHFPTLVLQPYIQDELLGNYERLMKAKGFVACEAFARGIGDLTKRIQVDRMLAERLEEKSGSIHKLLDRFGNSWQDVFYVQVAKAFGLHVNQDAFEQLSLQTPLSILSKHKSSLLHLESILFGQAGFLSDYFEEPYPLQLQQEYRYFRQLYKLQEIDRNLWKFLRMRPAGFPTIRLALFAQLIHTQTHMFSKFCNADTVKDMEKMFDFGISPYWETHYSFNELSAQRMKSPGESFIHSVIINAIIPVMFIYGKLQGESKFCRKAIDLFRELPAEQNHVIERWKEIDFPVIHAGDTQGLLQLKHRYCDTKRCLECAVGYNYLKQPIH